MKKQIKAFTFVELIVSTIIIVLLSTIWFYSYVWYLTDARDSERIADSWVLQSALKSYKQDRWAYPLPWDYYNITNSWLIVAYQWEMSKKVALSNLDKLPFDPTTKAAYKYSNTTNRQEYQIAATLENWDFPIAFLAWDYHTVSKNVLPTIMLAISSGAWTNIEIHDWVLWSWTTNRQKFILDKWENLPYDIKAPFEPVYWYEWLELWTNIINSWKVEFWQNSDFRNCAEIDEAWKSIWDWEYQYLTWWSLDDINCVF